ncbi:carbohydrate ABC transporter permease [Luxibacter massiliensis]|uniref:carbohydrate ABC transporter permease n=1 Tax=Luxibacter massiliensis TaxID=2219695 RepID=UPI000F066890|nr:sugar ABC transporter permease [Luxibacter massiliensis]
MDAKKIYPRYMLIIPVIVFIIFFVIPSTIGYAYAFTDWNSYVQDVSFVGFKNIIEVFSDRTVPVALINTIIFAGVKTIVVTVLGFVFALILNRRLKTRNAIRTVYFIPAIFSALVVGLIFSALFQTRNGTVNLIIQAMGMDKVQWLGSRWTAVFAISIAEVWRNLGYAIVITLAGLQSVSDEYIEAAKIDGASGWSLFKNITLPLIMPTVNVNILFSLIYGLKMFDLVYVMTGGGPGHDTETFGTLMMNEMSTGRYAQSVAINLVFTVILVAVAIVYQKFSERWENVQ